jgi:AcrR family transcriptional regulator
MSRGEETRRHIVRCAAEVFNRVGYAAATVSDLEEATGLRTGGIYRHFGGKEELALAAFDHAVGCLEARFVEEATASPHAVDRLRAMVDVYRGLATEPAVPGGCPVMNAAIETDAAGSAALRDRARRAMDRWRQRIRALVEEGQARGEVRGDVEAAAFANLFLSTMEGATMLTGLYGDRKPLMDAADHIDAHLESRVRA